LAHLVICPSALIPLSLQERIYFGCETKSPIYTYPTVAIEEKYYIPTYPAPTQQMFLALNTGIVEMAF
jgi:hypothetical protein